MKLFTIDDDFDMMLIFYVTIKHFWESGVTFWIRIYEHDECVSLTNQRGNFKVDFGSSNDGYEKKYFYCEFSAIKVELL